MLVQSLLGHKPYAAGTEPSAMCGIFTERRAPDARCAASCEEECIYSTAVHIYCLKYDSESNASALSAQRKMIRTSL